MANGDLELDTRQYADILDEALARIRVHNPEWRNFNESDPGVTLLQLFAFMTESVIYRTNRIPERSRRKFLRLLGVAPQAAAAAQGVVVFDATKGALETVTLAAGLEVAAGRVPFRTDNGLDVLPIESRIYYKKRREAFEEGEEELFRRIYASYEESGVELVFYETAQLSLPTSIADIPTLDVINDTLDGSVWVALLARRADEVVDSRKAIARRILTLAIVPAVESEGHVLPPHGRAIEETEADLTFEFPNAVAGASGGVTYRAATAVPDGNPQVEASLVQVELPDEDGLLGWTEDFPLEAGVDDLPPALEDPAEQERLITWMRVRPGRTESTAGGSLSLSLSYLGINAARVRQRAQVAAEFVGAGTGESDQSFTLTNTPIIADSLVLTVNGEAWSAIDDLYEAGPEVAPRTARVSAPARTVAALESKKFVLDRTTGEVRFGDGLHGARPPRGAVIQARYDYGGGLEGLVGVAAITKGATLPAGTKVSNPIPTWGADDAESTEETERRTASFLRNRDRLVSADDFEEITLATPGVDVGRVEVLALFHPDMPDEEALGVVTVMVIPRSDPLNRDAPMPDQLFLEAVCRHLDPRRLLTTELHVRGPAYEPVYASIGIDVVSGQDIATVREAVKCAIRSFLSPLTGDLGEEGWELEHDVDPLELLTVAARVSGVSRVNGVLLADAAGPREGAIEFAGLALPRLLGISVDAGDPQPVEDLLGTTSASDPATETEVWLPVPVIPEEC